jgi:collagenase-like PrtC family protease
MKKKSQNKNRLTLGPLMFHWTPEKRRDFYFRIADEADIDTVHLGEVVCAKRTPFFTDFLPDVAERLTAGGKEIVISTLALVASDREIAELEETCDGEWLVEANDLSAVRRLSGKPHIIGPYVNTFNEDTLAYFVKNGAVRVAPPPELSRDSIAALAGARGKAELEVTVFGRLPLSVSARCYHARAHGLAKDSCQYICGTDPDGKQVTTLDGGPLVAVNGTQTMSHGYADLLSEIADLKSIGVSSFRLSPQDVDMVAVAKIFRSVVENKKDSAAARHDLVKLCPEAAFINGFLLGLEGMKWRESEE